MGIIRLAKLEQIDKLKIIHRARHTFVPLKLNFDICSCLVNEMQVHKSITLIEVYANIINEILKEAIRNLSDLR